LLPVGQSVEVDFMMAGAADDFADATGTYTYKLSGAVQWFYENSIAGLQATTDTYWTAWLNAGTRAVTPDAAANTLLDRGLLATALHCDGVNGGVIAGFHNGAYPYVWPRDAVYAAITLARTGHLAEAENVYAWMKNTTYRDFESWGRKGFWKQKYSTDGYVIWGAPQIDETAVFPWGVWFQYKMTADPALLNRYLEQVRDAVRSCTQTSNDSRLFLVGSGSACSDDSPGLMHSNNVWEDSYATFIYSNANIVRGLSDAGNIFNALGLTSERDDATARASTFKSALDARMACNSENTDISQLGATYPFKVYSPTDSHITPFASRIASQLVNAPGFYNDGYGWTGLVNRYTGDGYWGNGSGSSPWGAGPWFLSSMWYGLYLVDRAEETSGKADIDAHKDILDRLEQHLGPIGFGAEQIAPRGIAGQPPPYSTGSLLYANQNDFTLETAWPNAWESMSTFVDSVMAYLHYEPDAPSNTMIINPKLPSAWSTMTFTNVTLVNTPLAQTHKVDMTLSETPITGNQTLTITNTTGFALNVYPTLKLLPGRSACSVRVNGQPHAYTPNLVGRLSLGTIPLATGPGAITTITITTVAGNSPDYNHSGSLTVGDIFDFLNGWFAGSPDADFDGNGLAVSDIFSYLNAWFAGCP
jgi:GH15 family glucan-1,4-alpha-glucosidase